MTRRRFQLCVASAIVASNQVLKARRSTSWPAFLLSWEAQYQTKSYTADVIGHAHTDLAWLWTLDETIRYILPTTFRHQLELIKEHISATPVSVRMALGRSTKLSQRTFVAQQWFNSYGCR
jgi:Glycosyl hydrolases family 38 N-terminal domain